MSSARQAARTTEELPGGLEAGDLARLITSFSRAGGLSALLAMHFEREWRRQSPDTLYPSTPTSRGQDAATMRRAFSERWRFFLEAEQEESESASTDALDDALVILERVLQLPELSAYTDLRKDIEELLGRSL